MVVVLAVDYTKCTNIAASTLQKGCFAWLGGYIAALHAYEDDDRV